MHLFRSRLRASSAVAAVACLFAATAAFADPAVSTTNLKVSALGGSSDGDGAFEGVAGLTFPLGEAWGGQAEAGLGSVDGDTISGLAGHIFKRNPDSYLAGLFVAHASEDEFGLDALRVGAEAEFYLGQVTLLLKGGYQSSDDLGDTGFGEAELHWYASDNVRLGGGVGFNDETVTGHAGAEWLLGSASLPGLALRADATFDDADHDSVMGGLTYYFGPDASLKDRHRRQDPDSALFSLFQAVEAARAAQCPVVELQQFKFGPSNDACTVAPPPPT